MEVLVIEVQDYDPSWPARFAALRERVWPAVRGVATAIEHVGSTSVEGLAAKPKIDLDVVVPSSREVAQAVAGLASLGYVHRGDLGIPGREAFVPPTDAWPHNLYVCPADSPALANHLAVRDRLRADPTLAQAYGALKRELAARYPDSIERYTEGKTDFLVAILREAGFAGRDLTEIDAANRLPPR